MNALTASEGNMQLLRHQSSEASALMLRLSLISSVSFGGSRLSCPDKRKTYVSSGRGKVSTNGGVHAGA